MKESVFLIFGGLSFLAGCAAVPDAPTWARRDSDFPVGEVEKYVLALAGDPQLDRVSGGPGNQRAADFVAAAFRQAGLKPGVDGQWFQVFPVPVLRVAGKATRLRIGTSGPLKLGTDYIPMAAGCSGAFDAPVVFAGFGLHNRIRGYNDYAEVSVRGCVAMVLAGEPHDENGHSRWMPKGQWTRLAGIDYKIRQAAAQGAVAVLIVAPESLVGQADILALPLGDGAGSIPAIMVSRRLADSLLRAAGRTQTADAIAARISSTGRPISFPLGMRADGVVELVEGQGRNVIGVAPAKEDEKQTIVIGAHYDHIPADGQLARDRGLGLRPGADDNASGVASLLMLAGYFSAHPLEHTRLVFVAFDAEELTFRGSRYYVSHPVVPLEETALMLAIDQVGRMKKSRINAIGNVASSPRRQAVIAAAKRCEGLIVSRIPFTSGDHWSDQAPFTEANIPTILLFGGFPPDYHRRTDTSDRINAPGIAATARLVRELLGELDSGSP